MNGKYKWILNESKRLHEARVTPAVCDKILYEHAIELVSKYLYNKKKSMKFIINY